MRPVRSVRVFGGLASVALLLPALALATISSPANAVITGNVMSGTASPMWQTNGIVRSVLAANGVIYAGGDFTAVRPPGTSASTNQAVARNRLAAFDASTGAVITSFNPNVNGRVSTMAMSPDGTRLYIGGNFRTVGGVTRNRVAAVNPTTGALITAFNPNAGAPVYAISASSSAVYIGGAFGRMGGITRSYLASVNATTGALNTGFNTTLERRPDSRGTTYTPTVTAIEVTPDASTLLVGGNFIGTNGDSTGGMASLDPTTGATRSWAANSVQPINTNCVGRVSDIASTRGTAYVTGEGDPPGCYEGTYSADIPNGELNWNSSCLGASQGDRRLDSVLYKGSHQHDCAFDEGGVRRLRRRHQPRHLHPPPPGRPGHRRRHRSCTGHPNTNGAGDHHAGART